MTVLTHMPYIFLYVADLDRARGYYQDTLGLPVTEYDQVASKYDCGSTILALNRVPGLPPPPAAVIVLSHGGDIVADPDGHRFRFAPGDPPRVTDVILPVADLDAVRKFYGEVLGMSEAAPGSYLVGDLTLSLREDPGGAPRPGAAVASYVFHADDCERERAALLQRGVAVGGVDDGDIGRTARFQDPAGYDFYLYEPSAVARTWPSWAAYRRIIGAAEEAP
jgi:catechol 2,3-dioxygenase-like lactoylglutathione lyase family enzyme